MTISNKLGPTYTSSVNSAAWLAEDRSDTNYETARDDELPLFAGRQSVIAVLVAIPALVIGTAFETPNLAVASPGLATKPFVTAAANFAAPDLAAGRITPEVDGSRRSRAIYDPIIAAPFSIAPASRAPDARATQILDETSRAALPVYLNPSTDLARGPLYVNRREIAAVYLVPANTAKGSPATLLVVPAPTIPVLGPPLARLPWQVVDTTADTPSTLKADAQTPVGARQTYTPPDAVRPVVDTSRAYPKALYGEAPPSGARQTFTAPERGRPIVDTSADTPKTLVAEVSLPVGDTQTATPPDRLRPVWDESVGTAKALIVDAQLPVGGATLGTAPPARQIGPDGTRSASPVLVVVLVPPVVPAQFLAVVDWRELGADTSIAIPKALYGDVSLPIGATWTYTPPDAVRPAVDTSKPSAPNILDDGITPPPVVTGGGKRRARFTPVPEPVLTLYEFAYGSLYLRGEFTQTQGRVEAVAAEAVPTVVARVSSGRISAYEAAAGPRMFAGDLRGRREGGIAYAATRVTAETFRGRAFRAFAKASARGAVASGRHIAAAGSLSTRGAAKTRFIDSGKVAAIDASDLDLLQRLTDEED
jgi:hypothetical protein